MKGTIIVEREVCSCGGFTALYCWVNDLGTPRYHSLRHRGSPLFTERQINTAIEAWKASGADIEDRR